MNKLKAILIIFFLLLFGQFAAVAESVSRQLGNLKKAVSICIERLDSNALLPAGENQDFLTTAARQLEFALLSQGKPELLEEDYYNFALYLIARHYGKYGPAIELLEYEYRLAGFKALKNWLQNRIETLGKLQKAPCPIDAGFSIENEFKSFCNMLKSF